MNALSVGKHRRRQVRFIIMQETTIVYFETYHTHGQY